MHQRMIPGNLFKDLHDQRVIASPETIVLGHKITPNAARAIEHELLHVQWRDICTGGVHRLIQV